MQICYECLKKQCMERGIALWKSDFFYSNMPKRCDFCEDCREAIEGVRLHTLGNRALTRHLMRVYEATARDPMPEEKEEKIDLTP